MAFVLRTCTDLPSSTSTRTNTYAFLLWKYMRLAHIYPPRGALHASFSAHVSLCAPILVPGRLFLSKSTPRWPLAPGKLYFLTLPLIRVALVFAVQYVFNVLVHMWRICPPLNAHFLSCSQNFEGSQGSSEDKIILRHVLNSSSVGTRSGSSSKPRIKCIGMVCFFATIFVSPHDILPRHLLVHHFLVTASYLVVMYADLLLVVPH